MNLLDRLVFREMIWPLGVGLLGLLQLLVVLQLLQLNDVVFGAAVTLRDLAGVTAALAPHFLVTAIPLAFMLSVQLGIGRLAGDRELLAMSAAGVHPLRFFRVPAAIALVLAVGVAALAHWTVPWGLKQLNRTLNAIIKRNLETGLTAGVFNVGLPHVVIYVAEQPEHEWQGVLIEDDVGEGAPLLTLAKTGRVEDTGGDALLLKLRNGELHRMEAAGETVARFDEGTFVVGVQESVTRKNKFAQNEAQLSNAELHARAAQLDQRHLPDEAARMRLEIVRRWAVPFACLAFVLLGVPLAMSGSGARGFAYLVTMGSFVAFYAMSRVSVALAEGGSNTWLAGFAPDMLMVLAGIPFLIRIVRRGIAH